MTAVTKISKQKVIRFIVGTALVCLLLCLLIAAAVSQRNDTVADLKFNMDLDGHAVITPDEIKGLLTKNPATDYQRLPIKELDLALIEATLESNPWIQNAEVFINNKNILELDITQNIPAARVFSTNGETYYLDGNSVVLPAAVSFPYPTPVFTNVPYLGDDEMSNQLKAKIAYLGHVIGKDTFWNAQVTQINLTNKHQFEMVTLMGDHVVKIGDTNHIQDKLQNLFIFYKEGLQKLGWNRYKEIDVRFAGQVVASPAMGYVAPKIVDTAVSLPDEDKATLTTEAATVKVPSPATTAAATTAATAPAKSTAIAAKPTAKKTETAPKATAKNTTKTTNKDTKKTTDTKKKTNNTTNNKQQQKRILPPQNR